MISNTPHVGVFFLMQIIHEDMSDEKMRQTILQGLLSCRC